MPYISEGFRARGEQWRRLAEYQQAQDLEALTAYVDSVLAGKTPAQSVQPARSYTRRLALFCALYFAAGLAVGLAIARAVGL